MSTYDSTSQFSRFALKTLSELFVHRQIALQNEKSRNENEKLKSELKISNLKVEELEKDISRVRSLAESEIEQIKEESNRAIRKWKDCATSIRPVESVEIKQLKEENDRLSKLVTRLSRAVHGLSIS